jgi:hypothetical protein
LPDAHPLGDVAGAGGLLVLEEVVDDLQIILEAGAELSGGLRAGHLAFAFPHKIRAT